MNSIHFITKPWAEKRELPNWYGGWSWDVDLPSHQTDIHNERGSNTHHRGAVLLTVGIQSSHRVPTAQLSHTYTHYNVLHKFTMLALTLLLKARAAVLA